MKYICLLLALTGCIRPVEYVELPTPTPEVEMPWEAHHRLVRGMDEHERAILDTTLHYWLLHTDMQPDFTTSTCRNLFIGIRNDPDWSRDGEYVVPAGGGWSIINVRDGLYKWTERETLVYTHEFTHYLAYCSTGDPDAGHTTPEYWGNSGVCGSAVDYYDIPRTLGWCTNN